MNHEEVAEWRGTVSADLRNINAACGRIEAALISHVAHDDRRFAEVHTQLRWLFIKVAGLVVLAGGSVAALVQP